MMNKEMVKFFRAFWIILFSNCSSCQNISFLNTIPAKFDLLHMNFDQIQLIEKKHIQQRDHQSDVYVYPALKGEKS